MIFALFILTVIIFYCVFSILLKLPPFKTVRVFKKRDMGKKHTLDGILENLAKSVSKIIPMGMLKETELQKVLRSAGYKMTPQEYVANALVYSVPLLLFAIPCYFIHPLLALIPAAFVVYMYIHKYNAATHTGDKRKLEIEKELPRFVSYAANTLKSSRNLIDLFNTYKSNYSSPLTEELSITVADMQTGNPEMALQRFESRINSPLLGELIRGLLSALRGDNMTSYFDNLSYKLSNVWRQRLIEQAQKKEPRVSMMAYMLFFVALVTVFVVLGVLVKSALSMMGG